MHGFPHTMIRAVDSSLVQAWESLLNPEAQDPSTGSAPVRPFDLAEHPRLLEAQVRAEMHALVRALAQLDYDAAAAAVREGDDAFSPTRFKRELEPFFADHDEIVFTPKARQSSHTTVVKTGSRTWDVQQVLLDPDDENLWCIYGEVDLGEERDPEQPLIHVVRIAT